MYRRNITNNILEALSDTPVVFLRGARQTGKSTLVQAIANEPYPARYVTLASPSPKDFSGLKVLRGHLGDKFVRGILICTGREIIPFGEDLHAVPVSILNGNSAELGLCDPLLPATV